MRHLLLLFMLISCNNEESLNKVTVSNPTNTQIEPWGTDQGVLNEVCLNGIVYYNVWQGGNRGGPALAVKFSKIRGLIGPEECVR